MIVLETYQKKIGNGTSAVESAMVRFGNQLKAEEEGLKSSLAYSVSQQAVDSVSRRFVRQPLEPRKALAPLQKGVAEACREFLREIGAPAP